MDALVDTRTAVSHSIVQFCSEAAKQRKVSSINSAITAPFKDTQIGCQLLWHMMTNTIAHGSKDTGTINIELKPWGKNKNALIYYDTFGGINHKKIIQHYYGEQVDTFLNYTDEQIIDILKEKGFTTRKDDPIPFICGAGEGLSQISRTCERFRYDQPIYEIIHQGFKITIDNI